MATQLRLTTLKAKPHLTALLNRSIRLAGLWGAILSVSLLLSCDAQKQLAALANLTKCQYKTENVSQLQLAGIPIQGKTQISQLGLDALARLATAYGSGNLPLTFTLNVGVRNPTNDPAAFSRMQYIMSLDGSEVSRGAIAQAFSVNGNSQANLPIGLNIDLRRQFQSRSRDALINLALNLAGQSSRPTMIGLQLKPSFNVGGRVIDYPNYFKVDTEYKAPR